MKLPLPLRSFLASLLAMLAVVVVVNVLRTPTAEAQTSSCPAFTRQTGEEPEVIIGTTPVRLPALCARRGVAIQNHGESTLWCTATGVAAHARVGRSWSIETGGSWALDAKDTLVEPARFREDGVTLAGYLLPAYSLNGLRLSSTGAQALGILAVAALQD